MSTHVAGDVARVGLLPAVTGGKYWTIAQFDAEPTKVFGSAHTGAVFWSRGNPTTRSHQSSKPHID